APSHYLRSWSFLSCFFVIGRRAGGHVADSRAANGTALKEFRPAKDRVLPAKRDEAPCKAEQPLVPGDCPRRGDCKQRRGWTSMPGACRFLTIVLDSRTCHRARRCSNSAHLARRKRLC